MMAMTIVLLLINIYINIAVLWLWTTLLVDGKDRIFACDVKLQQTNDLNCRNIIHMVNLPSLESVVTSQSPLLCRSWRREWNWSASAMVCRAPAPLRPAGPHYPSSGRSATCWRTSTTRQCKWRWCGPAGCASRPTSRWSRCRATASPSTQT